MDGDSNAPNAGPQQEAQAQAQGQQQTQPAPQPPTQMQQYALGAAGPSWAHQVYPPPLWGGYPAMPCNPSFSYPMMNGGQSNTNMMLPIPAFPMGAVPVGKPRRCDPATNRNKRRNEVYSHLCPPSGNGKSVATPPQVQVPDRKDCDNVIPPSETDFCARCRLWQGNFICHPCGHYGFCHRCLLEERVQATIEARQQLCQSCHHAVNMYIRCYRG